MSHNGLPLTTAGDCSFASGGLKSAEPPPSPRLTGLKLNLSPLPLRFLCRPRPSVNHQHSRLYRRPHYGQPTLRHGGPGCLSPHTSAMIFSNSRFSFSNSRDFSSSLLLVDDPVFMVSCASDCHSPRVISLRIWGAGQTNVWAWGGWARLRE